jgi:hypothetical protein
MSIVTRVAKNIPKNLVLLDVYRELTKPNVTVTKMSLKVLDDGTVVIDECQYIEEQTTGAT